MTPTDLNPTPPSWLASVVASMQANQDQVYANQLALYRTACSNWIAANTQNAQMNLPLTAPPAIPVRVIIYATTANGLGQYNAAPDPTIQPPVLPAITPSISQSSSGGFTTGAPAQTDTMNTILAQILADVLLIRQKVGA